MSRLVHNLHIHLVLFCCLSILNSGFTATTSSSWLMGNESDRLSLLAIKAKIVEDPLHVLSSWNDSIHFCQWQGVTCGRRHQRVTALDLHSRELVGSISPHLGNLSFLRELLLQNNSFGNEIPPEIGRLPRLQILQLNNNSIDGRIPREGSISPFVNLSSLRGLSLAYNHFDGSIPDGFGRLKNLQQLALGGSLPRDLVSISNASKLHRLEMPKNKFTGKVPNLAGLHNLDRLILTGNQLGLGEADDLNFISSLINATNLQVLGVNINYFGCKLPESIGNLSSNLQVLYLDNNQIFGSIPAGIVNLVGLQSLDVQVNQLTGSIPSEIGKLQNLQELRLSYNSLSGNIPSSIRNLSLLSILFLGVNNFQGNIPSSLGNCSNLQWLLLERNNLNGTIPKQVVSISSLSIYLDLSQNQLSVSLPVEVGNLVNLGSLDLSHNLFSGEIPSTLGSCTSLEMLCLGNNFFNGTIPSSFRFLRGLRELDLANNSLSGEIPVYLESFSLQDLNLSFNNFEGVVPTQGVFSNASTISAVGNTKLCGGVAELKLPKCNFKVDEKRRSNSALTLSLSIPFGFVGLALMGCVLYLCWFRKRRKDIPSDSSKNLLSRVSYQTLLKATDGFSSFNLIGVGSFGSVYKGVIDERIVAVKVINLLRHGGSKSFVSECEALRNIRHRNLVKVQTACSTIDYQGHDFKALVYEFMVNGSLEEWLHPNCNEDLSNEAFKKLNLLQRLDIIIDVACCALNYLHNQGQTPIVHCDLKPSNILLDKDMTGHVGDFGLAKFLADPATHDLSANETSSVGIRGTIGYTAPEYGMGSEVSAYGDIYSFGILMLEMFTGKRPTDEMFKDGLSLHSFVKEALPGSVLEILDPILFQTEGEEEESFIMSEKTVEWLSLILEIGVNCSSELPRERTNINDVAAKLHFIKDTLLGSA
ncbi:unnamed protein product [Camellia sinensis]